MASLKQILPPKIYDTVERAGINTTKQILILSKWDIKKVTGLCGEDVSLLKSIVADFASPKCVTGDMLLRERSQLPRVSSGCEVINSITNGGFQRGTLTEVYGESGSGKTQVGLQAAAHNAFCGSAYICTEDLFPVKRLQQIQLHNCNTNTNHSKNIFIEHVTEPNELLSCVQVRLPKLLSVNDISLVVLDSVAAPYRTDSTNYIQRAEDLRELAITLIRIAREANVAVLCINQVTSAFDGTDNVLPSLGLAWSNMVSARLRLKKLPNTIKVKSGSSSMQDQISHVRELSVVFAPDLSNKTVQFIITSAGILGV